MPSWAACRGPGTAAARRRARRRRGSRPGASAASGRPSPATGGHSSSIICCGTRPASDWRDSSVRQLSDSHSPMVSPQSRLSTGSHGFGCAEEQELRCAEPATFGDPGVHAACVGLQHGAGLGGQGGVVRHRAPPQTERAHAAVERERRPGRRSPTAGRRRRGASAPTGTAGRARGRSPERRRHRSQLAARMRGMPSASNPISTGPVRPGMRACCDRGGRVSHSTPVTTAATRSTMNTAPASTRRRIRKSLRMVPRWASGSRKKRHGVDDRRTPPCVVTAPTPSGAMPPGVRAEP